MDSFFEEADYDFTTSRPPASSEASGYLQDLIDFLTTVMMSVLIQLPENSKDYVYRGALTHCSDLLMVGSRCGGTSLCLLIKPSSPTVLPYGQRSITHTPQ